MSKHAHGTGIIATVVVVFFAGIVLGAFITSQNTRPGVFSASAVYDSSVVELSVPAVDGEGNGVLGKMTTEVRRGTGKVLVNIKDVITLGDTRESAQSAVKAAANFAGVDADKIDVIFNMEVNATAIDGPSAGANMALSIVFALRNETPRGDVMMTGTIDDYGRIGKIGSVYEKAKAAKNGGAMKFVVPRGQSIETETTKSRQCREINSVQYCRIVYKPSSVNVGESLGISVVEATTLAEAVDYFEARST